MHLHGELSGPVQESEINPPFQAWRVNSDELSRHNVYVIHELFGMWV